MEGSADSPSVDRVIALLEADATEEARSCLDTIQSYAATDRKQTLRSLRSLAEDHPAMVSPLCPTLISYLTDEERSVRLSTAKLFVTLAQSKPAAVLPAVDTLAERLADDEEFYYVRARSAEALGYVAVDSPEDVTDPETLADLRIGLSFDESEVKEKLAKALAYVALGDPGRLRHQVDSLAEHLDDENELVRYHLCTALVVIGCEHPAKLAAATEALTARLNDDNPYVRGRAAEALGLLARSDATDAVPTVEEVDPGEDDARSFVTERVQFAHDDQGEGDHEEVGTLASIRRETDEIVAAITSPDEGECPHCGLALPEGGPPMCPRCGAPY
jgi:HEAT repeat protein